MSTDVDRLVNAAVAMNLAQQDGDEDLHDRLSRFYVREFMAAGRWTRVRAHFRTMRWLRMHGIRHT